MKTCLLLLLATAAYAASEPREISYEGVLSMPSRLRDGRLISLAAAARPFSEMEKAGPEQPVYRRISTDNGNTWSADEKVFSYPEGIGTFVSQTYTLVDKKGYVHAFNVRYLKLANAKEKNPGHSELYHCISKDDGKTFSKPHRVNFGHDYTGAINSIIQLKSGRIVGGLSYTSDHIVEGVGQYEFRVVTFYSDDSGDTWKVGQDEIRVPFGPQVVHPGAIEPILTELSPDRVWLLIRTQTLRFHEAFSTNGGQSFDAPRASRFMAPDSPGAVTRLKDGRLVMCWNDIQSYPNGVSGHFRQHLYAAISSDNGASWSKPRRVAPLQSPENPGSRGDYPYLCETVDGSVLLYYTRFGLRPGASYEKQHNELVRLDPSWLQGSSH